MVKNMHRSVRVAVGWMAWGWIGLGVVQAGDILPVASTFPYPVVSPSPVTVALFQNGVDVTTGFRPVPGASFQVVVRVNGVSQSPPPRIELVPTQGAPVYDGATNPFLNPSTPLGTSAYRGQCGNTENPAGMPADAQDYDQVAPDILTATDCGGFAVVRVTITTAPAGIYTFVVPQDGDPSYAATDVRSANGIPADWEAQFCPSTFPCPTGREDADLASGVAGSTGDLRAALDEYRGTMVGGVLRRTDPRRKDGFFFVVQPRCVGAGAGPVSDPAKAQLTRLAGPSMYPRAVDGTLFDHVKTLLGSSETHVLAARSFPQLNEVTGTAWRSAEMVDRFQDYEVATGVVLEASGAADDRWVAKNAIYPFAHKPKAIRIIECVAPPSTPFLPPAQAPISGSLEAEGYVVLNTHKMIDVITQKIAGGGTRTLKLSTFQAGKWIRAQAVGTTLAATLAGQGSGDPAVQAHRDVLIGQYFKRTLAHEAGHNGSLEPPAVGHATDFSGLYLSSSITVNPTSSSNVFYIESATESYTTTDRSSFRYAPAAQ